MKRSPLPLIAFGIGALLLLFAGSAAAVIAALLGVLVLFFRAPHRARPVYLVAGAISGLGLVVLTPFVSSEPGTVLLRGPDLDVIDTEITVQEIAAGAVDGARLLGVALLFGAVLANIDTDRLHTVVGRVAPRSALLIALSVRLLPSLERDGVLLAETARARGLPLSDGGRISRTRHAATLTTPLLGSALERGVDIAEAMEARGYSGGRLSEAPGPVVTHLDPVVMASGLALGVLAAAAMIGAPGTAVAVGAIAAILTTTWAIRR